MGAHKVPGLRFYKGEVKVVSGSQALGLRQPNNTQQWQYHASLPFLIATSITCARGIATDSHPWQKPLHSCNQKGKTPSSLFEVSLILSNGERTSSYAPAQPGLCTPKETNKDVAELSQVKSSEESPLFLALSRDIFQMRQIHSQAPQGRREGAGPNLIYTANSQAPFKKRENQSLIASVMWLFSDHSHSQ